MDRNTTEQDIVNAFKAAVSDGNDVKPTGVWRFRVDRFDGRVEEAVVFNIVPEGGLNAIAAQLIGAPTGVNSAFRYIVVGTETNPGSLGSVLGGIGEVIRKVGATITSSKNTAILVCTLGGSTDSLTGVALGSAGMINHADSGQGTLGSHVNSVSTTLQDSDTLTIQAEITVGSHNL